MAAAAAGLKFVGGTKSTEELIAGCERGVLVTHFFYIRFLDQRTVLLTGLTRDGTFLIEKGKITQALKNFRWNESPLFMLSKIEEIGRAERTAAGQVMPALRVKDFNFTSWARSLNSNPQKPLGVSPTLGATTHRRRRKDTNGWKPSRS